MLWLPKIWQVSSCGKFMQHLETCLPIAEADRVLCCYLVMFLTVFFPPDVRNEKQLLSRFFCYSWLICLLGFWLRNAPLVKVIGNPISDAINFVFHLSWCVRGFKRLKWFCPSDQYQCLSWPSGAASRLESPSNYCIWCYLFVSFSSFM